MHIDTPFLLDEAFGDDGFLPDMSETIDAIRTTNDPSRSEHSRICLEHPHPSVRAAAIEALRTLRPSSLELRRQLSPVAAMRVRDALGIERTRKTREARATLTPARDDEDADE